MVGTDKEKRSSQLAEYLQGPRRRRKHHIVVAFGAQFDSQLAKQVMMALRTTYPQYSLLQVRKQAELARLSGRQIVAVLIDDTFLALPMLMEQMLDLKTKQRAMNKSVPLIFFTQNPAVLIDVYATTMAAYQEQDDYIEYGGMNAARIMARVSAIVATGDQRRGGVRVVAPIHTQAYLLPADSAAACELTELSLVGGRISFSPEGMVLRRGDQVRVRIPTMGHIPVTEGEFLHVAGRVRRVLMGGRSGVVVWQHDDESRVLRLTKIILAFHRWDGGELTSRR